MRGPVGPRAVNPNHSPAANFLATGRIDAAHPGVGAWVSYGLGSETQDLPGFVSLGAGFGQAGFEGSGYLPGQHQATRVGTKDADPEKMIRHLRNPDLGRDRQRQQLDVLQALNRSHAAAHAHDPQLDARVRAMETAFRMQFAAGEAFDVRRESPRVRDAYGPGEFAAGCLLARRLVERGVRFVQLSLGGWDHHNRINAELRKLCGVIDRPVAALLDDLKQRGLLDDTLVIWGGEFGRTPVSEAGDGRDHNHFGFTIWMAGGGVKGGDGRRGDRRVRVQGGREPGERPRPARHRPAPARPRPREADLPAQRPGLPPDRRVRPGGEGDSLVAFHPGTAGVPPAGRGAAAPVQRPLRGRRAGRPRSQVTAHPSHGVFR